MRKLVSLLTVYVVWLCKAFQVTPESITKDRRGKYAAALGRGRLLLKAAHSAARKLQTLRHKHPIGACVDPAFFDHLATCHLGVTASLVQAARSPVMTIARRSGQRNTMSDIIITEFVT
jgi:hypothetical protein